MIKNLSLAVLDESVRIIDYQDRHFVMLLPVLGSNAGKIIQDLFYRCRYEFISLKIPTGRGLL